jgi:hypothetical protein
LRLEDVVGDARRKIKSVLRAWTADEDIPTDLSSWREVSLCDFSGCPTDNCCRSSMFEIGILCF